MATDVSGATLRGLVIPYPGITSASLWAAESSYTQAGPRPGDPEPQQETSMTLVSSGTQDANGQLRLQCLRPGMPGDASFVWKQEGDTMWRGWDPPTLITHWECIEWTTGALPYTVFETQSPHIITLQSGKVLVVYQDEQNSGVASYRVRCAVMATDGTWSKSTIHTQTISISLVDFRPCALQLPDGRILCFFWKEDLQHELGQLRMCFSDDDGATWTLGSKACLEGDGYDINATDGVDLQRIRVAYKDNQILLVTHLISNDATAAAADVLAQWASSDSGATFSPVYQGDFASSGDLAGFPDVIVAGGRFLIFAIDDSQMPVMLPIASAYTPIDTVTGVGPQSGLGAGNFLWSTETAGPPKTMDAGELAVVKADDGTIWLYGSNSISAMVSHDDGATWGHCGQNDSTSAVGYAFQSDDILTYPRSYSACWHRGRVIIAHNWAANPGNEGESLGIMYLGGYSTVTMPAYRDGYDPARRVVFERSWLPFDVPADCGWTGVGAGTGSLDSPGVLGIVTVANSLYYSITPVGTVEAGCILRARLKINTSAGTGADNIVIRIRLADGTDDYDMVLRFGTGNLRLMDDNAGTEVDSVNITTTTAIEVLIASAGGDVRVWTRSGTGASNGTDREWALSLDGTLTNNTATPEATNLIRWGHGASSTSDSDWYEIHYVTGETLDLTGYADEHLAGGQTNPDDLFPRPIGADPVYIDGGTSIRAVDGPAFVGDEWDIDTRYDYSVLRLFPDVAPSPRVGWRSTSTEADCTIAVACDPGLLGTEESAAMSGVLAVVLVGTNIGTFALQGYDVGTTAWVNLADFSLSRDHNDTPYVDYWERVGSTIIPHTTDAEGDYLYLAENELAGGSFVLESGVIKKILGNSEGAISAGATGPKARILLSGVEVGDAAVGDTDPDSLDAVRVTQIAGLYQIGAQSYAGYRIQITAQDTADGDFRIGTMLIGRFIPFAADNSWGRVVETEANVEVSTSRDGVSRSRVLGPPMRSWELAWTDGLDTTQAAQNDASAAPDFVAVDWTAGAAYPLAAPAATAQALEGTLRAIDGPHGVVAYLPSVDAVLGGGSQYQRTRRDAVILSRITSPVRIEIIHGDELDDEVIRIASITGEEIV